MLKPYTARNNSDTCTSTPVTCVVEENSEEFVDPDTCVKFSNSDVLANIEEKVGHLSCDRKVEIVSLIFGNLKLFSDVSGRMNLVEHDVKTADCSPIKQNPYRANPFKMKILQNVILYMIKNDIIEHSWSAWSSPCILVPKPDKSYRFCTDY
ncbi:uncharacterized protein [Antedon mediterranea]|uniref:uncharacterized protein n=1 Tax=Antedon mediterranea TaxID=105859 RepID=UPI003AF631A6